MMQVTGALPTSTLDLLRESSPVTWALMGLLGLFSLMTWFFIALKLWQFRRVRRQGDRVFGALERTTRLEDAYHAVVKLPPSPYGRILKEGVNFFAELRPGALQSTADPAHAVLSMTQLEALRMVLSKEIGAERDVMARYLPWLATMGSVSPLLGLLGTVVGVMDAFIGIAQGGAGNISAGG